MAARDDDIRKGLALQEAGNWAAALECYLRAVAGNPRHRQGLFRAAIAHAHEGRFDESAGLLTRCLEAWPKFQDAAKALGGVRLSQARFEDAIAAFEKASEIGPPSAAVYCDQGTAHAALNQLERAGACFSEAAQLKPDYAEAHNKWGNLFRIQGRLDDAILSYKRAIRADRKHAQARYNLGSALQVQENFPKALDAYEHALALDPAIPGAENNMGLVLKALGRVVEASAAFRRALALKPDYVLAMLNLGTTLQAENRPQEAISMLQAALRLNPRDVRAFSNMGNAYVALNRPAEGLAAYGKALAIDPALAEIRYNVALAHLVMGDFESGWEGYDFRLESEMHRKKYAFAKPRWHRDQPLEGRTILVYAEQGFGDTLQFVRYVPLLEALGAQVILRVQVALRALLTAQSKTVTVITAKDPLPDHDFQVPLLSLPREFKTRLDSIPSNVPYIMAPAPKVAAWRTVFSKAVGLKVGLAWSGNPSHQFDYNRSVPLEMFARITADVPVHFFALQKDYHGTDRTRLSGFPKINDISRTIVDFEDTAAIVTALDLVITVDTSVAHLAGALGTRTWLMLGFAPDWRWLLNRPDSPWYPSVRLFRQPAIGDWAAVVEELRTELSALAR
jgi:tetratricopeptide (TPR) repeat protein